ncbi:hypothetical protein HDV01_005512 [Terramyces sp. JEL0728]|nr:hypothetical protein HDV01_005512 [Terramyces sp. JEL0728]
MHPPFSVNGHQFRFTKEKDKTLIYKCDSAGCLSEVAISIDYKVIGEPSPHVHHAYKDLNDYLVNQKYTAEYAYSRLQLGSGSAVQEENANIQGEMLTDVQTHPSLENQMSSIRLIKLGETANSDSTPAAVEMSDNHMQNTLSPVFDAQQTFDLNTISLDSQIMDVEADLDETLAFVTNQNEAIDSLNHPQSTNQEIALVDEIELDDYKYICALFDPSEKLYECAFSAKCSCESYVIKKMDTGKYNLPTLHSKFCRATKAMFTKMNESNAVEWVDESAKTVKELIKTKKPVVHGGHGFYHYKTAKTRITYNCKGKKKCGCTSIIILDTIRDILYSPTEHSSDCTLPRDKENNLGSISINSAPVAANIASATDTTKVQQSKKSTVGPKIGKYSTAYENDGKLRVRWKVRSEQSQFLKSIVIHRKPIEIEEGRYNFSLWRRDNIYYSCKNSPLGCKSVFRFQTEKQLFYHPTVHTMDCDKKNDEIGSMILRMKLKEPIVLNQKTFEFHEEQDDCITFKCKVDECPKTIKLQSNQIMDDLSTHHSAHCNHKMDESEKSKILDDLLAESSALVSELNPKETIADILKHRKVNIKGFEYVFCTSRPTYIYYMCPYRKTLDCKASIKLDLLDKKWSDRGSSHTSQCSLLNQLVHERYPTETVGQLEPEQTKPDEEIIEGLCSKLPVAIDGHLMKHTWSGKYIHYHCPNRWISGRMCPAQLKYKVGDERWSFNGTNHTENCTRTQMEGMKTNGIVDLYSDSSDSSGEDSKKESPKQTVTPRSPEQIRILEQVENGQSAIDGLVHNKKTSNGKYIYYENKTKAAFARLLPDDPDFHLENLIISKPHGQSETSNPDFAPEQLALVKLVDAGRPIILDGFLFNKKSFRDNYVYYYCVNSKDAFCPAFARFTRGNPIWHDNGTTHSKECTEKTNESNEESELEQTSDPSGAQVSYQGSLTEVDPEDSDKAPRRQSIGERNSQKFEDLAIMMDDDGPKRQEGRKSKRMRRSFIEWDTIFCSDREKKSKKRRQLEIDGDSDSSEDCESPHQISSKKTIPDDQSIAQSEETTSTRKSSSHKKRTSSSRNEPERKLPKKSEEQLWEEKNIFGRNSKQKKKNENEDNQWAALLSKFPGFQKKEDSSFEEIRNPDISDTFAGDILENSVSGEQSIEIPPDFNKVKDFFNDGPELDAEIDWEFYENDEKMQDNEDQAEARNESHSIITVSISSSDGDVEKFRAARKDYKRGLIKAEMNSMEQYLNFDYEAESEGGFTPGCKETSDYMRQSRRASAPLMHQTAAPGFISDMRECFSPFTKAEGVTKPSTETQPLFKSTIVISDPE